MSDEAKMPEHAFSAGLSPASVAGADPGSTYKVVARTGQAYVAIRRIGLISFRVRAERLDHKPFVAELSEQDQQWLAHMGFTSREDGTRLSGVATGPHQLNSMIGMLTTVMVSLDVDWTAIEQQPDPQLAKFNAHVLECAGCAHRFDVVDFVEQTTGKKLPPIGDDEVTEAEHDAGSVPDAEDKLN